MAAKEMIPLLVTGNRNSSLCRTEVLASISSGSDVMLVSRTEAVNAWKDRNEVDSSPDSPS